MQRTLAFKAGCQNMDVAGHLKCLAYIDVVFAPTSLPLILFVSPYLELVGPKDGLPLKDKNLAGPHPSRKFYCWPGTGLEKII